jgi:hypothetical protein
MAYIDSLLDRILNMTLNKFVLSAIKLRLHTPNEHCLMSADAFEQAPVPTVLPPIRFGLGYNLEIMFICP